MKNKSESTKSVKEKLREMTSSQAARFICAGYLLVMLLAQLFTFEKFPLLLGSIGITGVWSVVVAIALVVAELLGLGYLIVRRLPKILNKVSAASVFVALLGLTTLEVVALFSDQTIIFGATFNLPAGSWSLFLLAGLWTLALWGIIGQTGRIAGLDRKRTAK